MRAHARYAPVLAALALALLAHDADPTLIPRLDLGDLVGRSRLVFTGTVLDRQSEWEDGRIVTRNTLLVEEAIKPDEPTPATLTLVTLGGEVGDVGLWVPGESRFEVGGRYLVFARRDKADGWRVTGMAQGSLRIVRDEGGTDWVLPSKATGIVTWTNGELVPALPFLTKPVVLEDLKGRIRDLVEEAE